MELEIECCGLRFNVCVAVPKLDVGAALLDMHISKLLKVIDSQLCVFANMGNGEGNIKY